MTDERQAAPTTVTGLRGYTLSPRANRAVFALDDAARRFGEARVERGGTPQPEEQNALKARIELMTYLEELEAALSAAHPPAPSNSLEQADKECQARSWEWSVAWDEGRYDAFIWVGQGLLAFEGYEAFEGEGNTPLAALRAAMSTALAAASGEPAQAKE